MISLKETGISYRYRIETSENQPISNLEDELILMEIELTTSRGY